MNTLPPPGETVTGETRLLPREGETLGTIGDMSFNARHRRRIDWNAVLVIVTVLAVAGIMVAYGAAGSYESLSQLAARHAAPLPRFFPVGVDGGLVGFLVIDIAVTLMRRAVAALHMIVRLFGAASIFFNASAGWPDPVAAGIRVMAPALLLILSEVVRLVILRGQREGEAIPWKRWLLAPAATFRLWRRMQLWRITDYERAIDMEVSRLRAVEQLRARFPRQDWRTVVPGDVAWCLDQGLRMEETLAIVAGLCAPTPALPPVPASGPRKRQSLARAGASRKRRAGAGAETIDSQAQALAEYMNKPGINGREMADALGLSPSRGRALLAMAKQVAPDTGPIPRVRAD